MTKDKFNSIASYSYLSLKEHSILQTFIVSFYEVFVCKIKAFEYFFHAYSMMNVVFFLSQLSRAPASRAKPSPSLLFTT